MLVTHMTLFEFNLFIFLLVWVHRLNNFNLSMHRKGLFKMEFHLKSTIYVHRNVDPTKIHIFISIKRCGCWLNSTPATNDAWDAIPWINLCSCSTNPYIGVHLCKGWCVNNTSSFLGKVGATH